MSFIKEPTKIENSEGTVTISIKKFDELRDKEEAFEKNRIEVEVYSIWNNRFFHQISGVNYFTKDEIVIQLTEQVKLLNEAVDEKGAYAELLRKGYKEECKKIADMSISEFRKWRKEYNYHYPHN